MGIIDSNVNESAAQTQLEDAIVKKQRKPLLPFLGVILLLILTISGSVFLVKQKPELLGLSKNSAETKEEVESLIAKVGKIIQLPENELPTIATVSDLSKTNDREFFRKAKEGDKVLVYQNAKKAYLYRPSENKIIEVGVVNIPEPTGDVAGQQTEEITVITPTPLPEENSPTPTPVRTLPTNTPAGSHTSTLSPSPTAR